PNGRTVSEVDAGKIPDCRRWRQCSQRAGRLKISRKSLVPLAPDDLRSFGSDLEFRWDCYRKAKLGEMGMASYHEVVRHILADQKIDDGELKLLCDHVYRNGAPRLDDVRLLVELYTGVA